jgi:hypothetical protein
MNQKTAKLLRNKVYGSGPKRNEGKYKWHFDKDLMGSTIQRLICVGKRAEYLKLKKEFR